MEYLIPIYPYFNSSMVQLKEIGLVVGDEHEFEFQFLYGTIKSMLDEGQSYKAG